MQILGTWQVEETGFRQLLVQRPRGREDFFSQARLRGWGLKQGLANGVEGC